MQFQDGGDKAELVGLIFPVVSLVLHLPTQVYWIGARFPHTLGHLKGHIHGAGCRVRCGTGPISAWAHCNASLSTEIESSGKGLGKCPQDALLGLSHLLRSEEGMHLGMKWGHKLSLQFYPSPDLPPLEKASHELQY